MHEDEDEDDRPLVRPASRNGPAEKRRDPAAADEDLLPVVPARLPAVRKRKEPPMWQDPTAILEQEVRIISKLSEERNLRDLHLKHYHM